MEKVILLKDVEGRDQDAILIHTIHYFEDRISPYDTGVIAVLEMVKPVTLDAKHGTVCAPGLSWGMEVGNRLFTYPGTGLPRNAENDGTEFLP